MPSTAIAYRIELHDAHAHQFRVTLTVPRPAAQQRLSLPAWIPGSYLVREFARHLSQLTARQGARAVPLAQLDKATWQAECRGKAALVVQCLVYAFDPSVRCAFFDSARAFFNPSSLCLRVEGREADAHRIELARVPRGWQVATAMASDGARGWRAADYDELIDHPFEVGRFTRLRFRAHGVPHELVVTGAYPSFDADRLVAETRRACEAAIELWHGASRPRPPFARYVFLLRAVDDGYGGLEHRASTALVARRRDLPQRGVAAATEGHVSLLGLIAHEYFHAWNVKRLAPASFARLDLARENYTELLWFFEGFTSYYDDLLLRRAGLIDAPRYLALLAKAINTVAATPGRRVQSVAQASFDAWVKYYRSDENTPNATVSYYLKGSLVALALDLTLRREGHGTLDEALRALWQATGGRAAVDEATIAAALAQAGARSYARELAAWVHGTGELPLAALLDAVGVTVEPERMPFAAALGLRLAEGAGGVTVKQVLAGCAAQRAGVSAGDELIAIDGWRLRRLDEAQLWLEPGAKFDLLVARDQRLVTLRVQPDATPARQLQLRLAAKPDRDAAARRRGWIGA